MLKKKQVMHRQIVNIVAVAVILILLFVFQQKSIIPRYPMTLLISVGISIILAVSLNLTTGILGQLTLGHAGFMAVGAYTAALFTKGMTSLPFNVSFPVGLILGGLMAALISILIGIPALRLRGDYLAIITLAFGEIIRSVLTNLKFTGGAQGLRGIKNFPRDSKASMLMYVAVCVIITIFVSLNIIRSRQGRAMLAIRDNEIAAEASGIPTTYYKMLAFGISAFFAGIAGGLYAHHTGVLNPSTFVMTYSVEMVAMVVMGGLGSVTGSVIAATLLTLLPEGLRMLKEIPALAGSTTDYRMLIYAILLILIILFLPSGLAGLWGGKEFSLYGIYQKIFHRKKQKPAVKEVKADE